MRNVEIVRGMFEAFQRRDVAAAVEPFHPDMVWDATDGPIDDLRGVYDGRDAVLEMWGQWLAAWDTITWPEPEFIDACDKVVVWTTGQVNRGRTSGIEVAMNPYGAVWELRDGKVVRVTDFSDRRAALSAAGLH